MRRLLILFASLGIVLWGRSILAGESAPPDVLVRDGLLVVLVGLVIFALNARSPAFLQERSDHSAPPIPRKISAGVGFAVALVGSVWLALTGAGAGSVSNSGLIAPLLLWLIGLGIGFVGLYWPQAQPRLQPDSAPPDVWSLEAARQYLQRREAHRESGSETDSGGAKSGAKTKSGAKSGAGSEQSDPSWLSLAGRTIALALVLLTFIALLLRGWNFAGLSSDCLPAQCDALVATTNFVESGTLSDLLTDLLTNSSPLYTLATSLVLGLFGGSTTGTLLLGLVLGALSIPLFFFAASRFVSPASALLGTLFVVFSPLAILWSRYPVPGLVLALLVTGLLALRPLTGQTQRAERWAVLGGLAGLTLFAAPPPLTWLLLLWFVLTPPQQRSHQLFYYLPLAVVSLPRLAAGMGTDVFAGLSTGHFFAQSGELTSQWLLGEGNLPGLLALLGAAYLVRHLRWERGRLWGLGLLLVGLPVFAIVQPIDVSYLSPLFVLLAMGAVVALDQFVGGFAHIWRSVLPPRRVAAVAIALLVVAMVVGNGGRLRSLAGQSEEKSELAQSLASAQEGQPAPVELQRSSSTELPTDLPELPFSLVWQVGSCGADFEQFQQPRGVVLNRYNELVYVADQGNRRVVLRELRDGSPVDFYTDDAFEEPFDLDVNLLGQVFLLDAVTQTIYRFEEPAGLAIAQPNETAFYRPRGMGMGLDGSFYVADTGGARVVQLTGVDGAVAFQSGGPDSPLGQGQPVDVLALPTGALYVVTAQDGTLWRLDTGESWPAVAPANTYDAPHLAGLTTSFFFLTDPERRLITYYNESGRALGQLRSDIFAKPVGVGALIVDEQVNLVVSDSNACQISLWRAPLAALPQ